MQVQSINILQNYQTNKQTNKNVNFKGTVEKSVYHYLDAICPNTTDAIAMKNEIITELEKFMAPLHKDTTFLIKNNPAIMLYSRPFPENGSYTGHNSVDIGDYQTFFYNKQTKTSFSLSKNFTHVVDKDKEYPLPKELRWIPFANDLSDFKSHIDEVIKFFGKDRGFDPDNILYNLMFRRRPWYEDFLPDMLVKRLIQRDKKLAPQFQTHYKNDTVYVYEHELRF